MPEEEISAKTETVNEDEVAETVEPVIVAEEIVVEACESEDTVEEVVEEIAEEVAEEVCDSVISIEEIAVEEITEEVDAYEVAA